MRPSRTSWSCSARSHRSTTVLAPVAQDYQADLYLPTGEISDTLMHQHGRRSAQTTAGQWSSCASRDCDPAGWQMPISHRP